MYVVRSMLHYIYYFYDRYQYMQTLVLTFHMYWDQYLSQHHLVGRIFLFGEDTYWSQHMAEPGIMGTIGDWMLYIPRRQ